MFQEEDKIVRVYGCATMWHENSEEMAEMLKSIFRMDEDYAARFSSCPCWRSSTRRDTCRGLAQGHRG